MDPRRPELYWFMVCKPNCELNAVRHASFQFEEVSTARSYGDLEVRRAVIKLGRAWTAYYATWSALSRSQETPSLWRAWLVSARPSPKWIIVALVDARPSDAQAELVVPRMRNAVQGPVAVQGPAAVQGAAFYPPVPYEPPSERACDSSTPDHDHGSPRGHRQVARNCQPLAGLASVWRTFSKGD